MFSKLRYGIVILAGVLIVGAAYWITGSALAGTKEETDPEAASFEVSEFEPKTMGNSSESAEQESFDVQVPVPEEEPSETTEPEEPAEKDPVTEEETTETKTPEETACEEPEPVGLRAYFRDKLIIDPEKVSLYLNIREEADEDSTILAVMYPNDIMTFIGAEQGWYEVQCDGFTGFVNADYVLTGDDVYLTMKDTVAYAVMAKNDSVFLYSTPDSSTEVILAAAKSDFFRVVGITGNYFEVSVISPIYSTLFVERQDVLLYYLFLGPGNDNEMDDETEAYFGELDILNNLEKAKIIQAEAEYERASYEAELESIAAEQEAQEEAYRQELERQKKEAAKAAAQEAAARAEEARRAQEAASASGQAQYIGNFRITGYCHCPICCHAWGSNDPNYQAHGSTGMLLQDNYSVAVDASRIAPGTRLLINGHEYIAADTGVAGNSIDIYRRLHSDASAIGEYYADVYILP